MLPVDKRTAGCPRFMERSGVNLRNAASWPCAVLPGGIVSFTGDSGSVENPSVLAFGSHRVYVRHSTPSRVAAEQPEVAIWQPCKTRGSAIPNAGSCAYLARCPPLTQPSRGKPATLIPLAALAGTLSSRLPLVALDCCCAAGVFQL